MNILEALDDPALFGSAFTGATWAAWRAFLAALFGLPLEAGALALYRAHTGRETPPAAPATEAYAVVGRRGGKSRIAALVAVYLACFRTYQLAAGERGVVMVIAGDRRQARVIMRYVVALLEGNPMLERLIGNRTAESIELATGISIEIHTASFRAVRGYTLVGAVLDELAFWRTDDAAEPDYEIVAALRPGMATVPGALLLGISSPYARRGVLHQAHREHFGKEDAPVLVWQAPTAAMNPSVPDRVVQRAYAEDPASAAAEYGAEFRADVETYLSREAVDACVVLGRFELPPIECVRYSAFVDPSGGSSDSMTLAIGHLEEGCAVLDCLREVRPPFSPDAVVKDFAEVLRRYRITELEGDRYGAEWVAERFRSAGVRYVTADKAKSDLYRELLPAVNARTVELLDHPRLIGQLCALERRTARGGRDSIDHAPGAHDDLSNAAAGVVRRPQNTSTTNAPPVRRASSRQRARTLGVHFPD